MTRSVWSPSIVVKKNRPSADAAAPCGWSPALIVPITRKVRRSTTWILSPVLLVTYSFGTISVGGAPDTDTAVSTAAITTHQNESLHMVLTSLHQPSDEA